MLIKAMQGSDFLHELACSCSLEASKPECLLQSQPTPTLLQEGSPSAQCPREVGSVQRLCPSSPTMEYSCLVWMGAFDTSLSQLDRVQRRALRLIGSGTYLPRLSHRKAIATSTSSTTWRTPTLLQLCYLQQALPTHDQLDSPPLNDTTTSYCLPTLPTRPYDTSGFPLLVLGNVEFSPSPLRSFSILLIGIAPRTFKNFKVNVHRHILHSSWLAATDSL